MTTDPTAIAAHLRTLPTAAAGADYLAGLNLTKAGLIAVAAALGRTRVDSLSKAALLDAITTQAITAPRKYQGLRAW